MTFAIGRGHDCKIRLGDITVSRLHAYLKFTPEGFFIEDNRSKFGTLTEIKQVEIDSNTVLALQIGRSFVSFEVKKQQLDKYHLLYNDFCRKNVNNILAADTSVIQHIIGESMAIPMEIDAENVQEDLENKSMHMDENMEDVHKYLDK